MGVIRRDQQGSGQYAGEGLGVTAKPFQNRMQKGALRPGSGSTADFFMVIAHQQNRLITLGIKQTAKTGIAAQQVIQTRAREIVPVYADPLCALRVVTAEFVIGNGLNV